MVTEVSVLDHIGSLPYGAVYSYADDYFTEDGLLEHLNRSDGCGADSEGSKDAERHLDKYLHTWMDLRARLIGVTDGEQKKRAMAIQFPKLVSGLPSGTKVVNDFAGDTKLYITL